MDSRGFPPWTCRDCHDGDVHGEAGGGPRSATFQNHDRSSSDRSYWPCRSRSYCPSNCRRSRRELRSFHHHLRRHGQGQEVMPRGRLQISRPALDATVLFSLNKSSSYSRLSRGPRETLALFATPRRRNAQFIRGVPLLSWPSWRSAGLSVHVEDHAQSDRCPEHRCDHQAVAYRARHDRARRKGPARRRRARSAIRDDTARTKRILDVPTNPQPARSMILSMWCDKPHSAARVRNASSCCRFADRYTTVMWQARCRSIETFAQPDGEFALE